MKSSFFNVRAIMGLVLAAHRMTTAQSEILEKTISTGPWVLACTSNDQDRTKTFDLGPLGIPPEKIVSLSAIFQDDSHNLTPVSVFPNVNLKNVSLHGGSLMVTVTNGQGHIVLSAGERRCCTYVSQYDNPSINRATITIRYLSSSPDQKMPLDNALFYRLGGWDIPSTPYFGVGIPGLPVTSGSVTDFHTIIYNNPQNALVEVWALVHPSGWQTSYRRDRGGNEVLTYNKQLQFDVEVLPQNGDHTVAGGVFRNPEFSGWSSNRGWSMAKYSGATGTSTLSQPFFIKTKAIEMGGWDAGNAVLPLELTLSDYGIQADRIVDYQAIAISDLNESNNYKINNYHSTPKVEDLGGGGSTYISGNSNKIIINKGPQGCNRCNDPGRNRGYITISYRAADCQDGSGGAFPSSMNIGNRTVSALVWNGNGYSTNSTYGGCNGYNANANAYVIENTGDNIWTNNGTFDAFRFVYKGGSGSRTMVVKVEQLENTNAWARGGIMLREGTANNGRYAGVFVTPGNGLIFQARTSIGGGNVTVGTVAGTRTPVWLKLYYDHASYATRAFYSYNGSTWYQIGNFLGASFFGYNMGLACASRSNYPNTSVYTGLTVTPPL